MTTSKPILFRCPRCGLGELEGTDEEGFTCAQCNGFYPTSLGFPDFLGTDQHWDFAPPELMARVLPLARSSGWEVGLDHLLKEVHLEARKSYFVGGDRLWWRWIIPMDATSRVLVVGSGLGAEIKELSSIVSFVAGIDITPENLQFIKTRLTQEGVENYSLARASAIALPFPSNSFDVIQLIGVFEWLGYAGVERSAIEYQQQALKEFSRCLRPSGTLVIGIENRYCWSSFLGGREPHFGIPFLGLLSPRLGSVVTKRVIHKPYRIVLHSYRRLQRLAKKSGLREISMYYPFPTYANPRALVPLWSNAAIRFFGEQILRGHPRMTRSMRVLFRLLARLHLVKWFCTHFIMLASKPGPQTPIPLISRVLSSERSNSGGEDPAFLLYKANRVSGFEFTRLDPYPRRVHKIRKAPYPRRALSPNGPVIAEYDFLAQLKSESRSGSFPEVPEPLGLSSADGTIIATQSFVNGEPIRVTRRPSRRMLAGIQAAVRWLTAFQEMTRQDVPATPENLRRYYLHPLELGLALVSRQDRQAVRDLITAFLEEHPSRLPISACHGDFHFGHVLLDSDQVVGVIDWEFAETSQLTFFDWFTFVLVLYKSISASDEMSRADAMCEALRDVLERGNWASPGLNPVLASEFNRLRIRRRDRLALLLLHVFFLRLDDPGPCIRLILDAHRAQIVPFDG